METNIIVYPDGRLLFKNKEYRSALGRSGVSADKKEGDGATPAGVFNFRESFFRPDRLEKPKTGLFARRFFPEDIWVDDPADKMYNKLAATPYPAHHEVMWREDEIYDIVVVIGYNDSPIVPGKGSAIFMHVARPDFSPTEGCIALRRGDLLEILRSMDIKTKIEIKM